MIKVKIKRVITALVMSVVVFSFVSCSDKNKDSSKDKDQNGTPSTNDSSQKQPNDFSGLASQKYADVLAHNTENTKYTLKWSYKGEYSDKETNYIYYDGDTQSYSLNMTRPLFNDAKFIVKDHKMYDIYDDSNTYITTDLSKTAMEYGYLTIEEFESYAADIFEGLSYLGSDTGEIDGVKYNFDAFNTKKSVELRFFMTDNDVLYAIEAKHDNNQDDFMFIDEFSTECPENAFEIPEGYTEEK